MKGLAILSFEGDKKLVFIDKICRNNLAVISDIYGNKRNFHMDYITDLSSFPEQHEYAYNQFQLAHFSGVNIF